jgi:hypothetical protein
MTKRMVCIALLFCAATIGSPAARAATFTPLYSFPSFSQGAGPTGPLTFGSNGDVYGTTYDGGSGTVCTYGCGTFFELTPRTSGGWEGQVIYSFTARTDGETPQGGVVFDAAGNLYGVTIASSNQGGGGFWR